MFHSDQLAPIRYTNLDFQSYMDSRQSTSNFVFTLSGATIIQKSVKQSCIVNSTMEAKYIATFEVEKEVIWLRKFLMELGVVPLPIPPMTLFYDNNGAMTQSKELRNHRKGKSIQGKYYLICEIVLRGDVAVEKIPSTKNLVDAFTNTLSSKVFDVFLICFKGQQEIVMIKLSKHEMI